MYFVLFFNLDKSSEYIFYGILIYTFHKLPSVLSLANFTF